MPKQMEFLPKYDELWVISDIHMGGERCRGRNFQIFRRGERLGTFIRHLTSLRPDDDVALVLNGDVIDSLAEDAVPGYVALDIETVQGMMKHLYEDEAFAPVWTALRDFVHTDKRHLAIVVGNHDIEFALTPVEAAIRQRLAEGDPAADARILFSTHGGGFGCWVGGKRVFCTHGNEVDGWNTVDYSKLGQLDNAMIAGRRVSPTDWEPNAGTRMVIDLMNKVKARHPFVDLLKPEIKPVLSIVLTLDSQLVKEVDLTSSFKIIRDRISGALEVSNLLSSGGSLESVSTNTLASAAIDELLGAELAEHVRGAQGGLSEDELLVRAELSIVNREPALASAKMEEGATLGWSDLVAGWLGRVEPIEALRRALVDWLGGDKTFDLSDRDNTFKNIVPRAGPRVDFVVTGHTHLARALEYEPGRHYFNCGTWIRLLRFTPEALNESVFENRVYSTLEEGTMDALDKAIIPGSSGAVPLVLDRTNAVRISRMGSEVKGELLRVKGGENGKDVEFEREKGGIDA